MKKILLTAVAILALTTANAQEKEVSTYKPNAGDVTAEFSFSGGIGTNTVGLRPVGTNTGIRGRYFLKSNQALRGGLNISHETNSVDSDNSTGLTAIELAIGIEKHFKGTKRLSPYIGGELGLGFFSPSATVAGISAETKSTTNFGVKGVLGADYYFVENVYLGVEGSWGIGYTSVDKSSSINITPAFGGVKLGFVF